MAETELTVEVNESFESAKGKLERKGFKFLRDVVMEDIYFAPLSDADISLMNTKSIIAYSILVRTLTNKGNQAKTLIVHKNKKYDENGNVTEEEKVQTEVMDKDKIVKILTNAGLNKWFTMKQKLYVLSNGKREICLQEVENLGLFLEYEEDESHSGLTLEKKIEVMKSEVNSLSLVLGSDYFVKKLEMLRKKQAQEENEG